MSIIQEIENRVLLVPSELRAVTATDGGPTRISGYAAKFNVTSAPIGGLFVEKIAPGAFRKNLPGADIRLLVNHDPGQLLARTKSGTLKVTEDEVGLRFDGTLPDTALARDVITQINRGDLDSMSFGFRNAKDTWADGKDFPVRTLTEATVFDISVVTFPAYDKTEVGLRGLDAYRKQAETRTRAAGVRLRLLSIPHA